MSKKPIQEAVLFRTSSGSDVQCSGGTIAIAGLRPVSKKDITGIFQVKYRPEVVQVVTVAGTSYTPTSATRYAVQVYDPTRVISGYTESPKIYSYTTPVDVTTIGATAALQREAISLALVAAINADPSNHTTAASLGTGTGFTVTDNGGYYPVFSQTMTNIKGISSVSPLTNSDGTGFASTNVSVTTAGVYSFGVGSKLAEEKPVISATYGNLISGVLMAPPVTINKEPAVSGQNYDGFCITSMKEVEAIPVGGQYAYQVRTQWVFVDNGTGSSTANLAGFKSFERAFLANLFQFYGTDTASIYWMGSNGVTCGGLNTGLASGVSLDQNSIHFGNGFATAYYPLGTSTLVALTSGNDGVNCVLDATSGEGVELSASAWANSLKSAIVGKTAFSVYAKVTVDDVSGVNPMWVGFRKKAAANTTYTAYSDFAFIGLGNATGDIFTSTEINGAGNTNTDTTQNWADAETHTLEVRVSISGAVTFFLDGYKPTVTQAITLDAGDEMIPVFCYALQTSDIGTPSVLEGAFLTTDQWRG